MPYKANANLNAQVIYEQFLRRLPNGVTKQTTYDDTEEQPMEPMDLIRDKFSQDCTIETVLHLVMADFDMTEKEA